MKLRFRTLDEVVAAWLVGAGLALLVSLWPAAEPCPHSQACAIEPMPAWQKLLIFAVLLGPGGVATILWFRSRRSARTVKDSGRRP